MIQKTDFRKWKSSIRDSITYNLFFVRESVTGYPCLKRDFKKNTGYEIDLNNPKSFNEKVNWKKIYDRNPLLPIIADKYRVRDYIKNVIGPEKAERILIPLLYVTDKPDTIPFDELPKEYIIKANHGSGKSFRLVVEKGNKIDRQLIITKCNEMLETPFGIYQHEWAYQKIKRKIIIEKLLRDKNGNIPHDHKLLIIHGKCEIIDVIDEKYALDRSWSYLNGGWKIQNNGNGSITKKPENLYEMINLAELLGSPFDFIRVDLYSEDGHIYFAELTNYPASGYDAFDPLSFDFEIGSKWIITPKYWKKLNRKNEL